MINQKSADNILKFAGYIGLVTPLQIAQQFCSGKVDAAEESLDAVVGHYKYLDRVYQRKIPRRCGGESKNDKVDVYYLTKTGKRRLEAIAPEIAAGTRYTGKPSGGQLDQMFHDLMVNKAILWLLKGNRIADFESEKRMRATVFTKLLREGRKPENELKNYSLGDFRVAIENLTTGARENILCELSLSLDADQLLNKTSNIGLWFVHDKAHADVIESVKSVPRNRIVVLGDLNSPEFAEDAEKKKLNWSRQKAEKGLLGKLNETEENIIKELKKLEAGTAGAVARRIWMDRTSVSRAMKKLERAGWLVCDGVHLYPGREKGTRAKLYSLLETKDRSLATRQFHLARSICIDKMFESKYYFDSVDGQSIRFENFSEDENIVFVIDHHETEVKILASYFEQTARKHPDATVLYLVWTEERMQKIAMLDSRYQTKIFDIRELTKKKKS